MDETISEMLEDEGVMDLMESIGIKGYFPGEPLLIIEEDAGRFIVVEGNRRLAAVKLLNGEIEAPSRKGKTIDLIKQSSPNKPTNLPCAICTDRSAVSQYLGYRHISGIKEWDSLSKAYYVKELIQANDESKDYREKLNNIRKMIGSRSGYLARLMAGLYIYEKAKEKKFFNLPIDPRTLDFSLITTAISYADISSWLGLENLYENLEPQINLENTELMFKFLFVIRGDSTRVIGESRQLSEFSHVVASEEAMKVLIDTGDLEAANLLTDGPAQALTGLLEKCSKNLLHAWSFLGDGKISDILEFHLDKAKEIRNQTRKLVDVMENFSKTDD